jgi:hypothetical protein
MIKIRRVTWVTHSMYGERNKHILMAKIPERKKLQMTLTKKKG